MKTIAKGAEGIIYKEKNTVVKHRVKKGYRHPELDKKLRVRRTRAESKLIDKSSKIINVPKLISIDEKTSKIEMQFIEGKRLSDNLDKIKNYQIICKKIGSELATLHDSGIIHGDLTTSNLIFSPEGKVYFIDFGLGFHSEKVEDKAVDLHLIKEALQAKHSKISKKAFDAILKGYKKSLHYQKTIKQLEKVEKRGRYKQQY